MRDYKFRGFHPDRDGEQTAIIGGVKTPGEWVRGYLFIDYRGNRKIRWYDARYGGASRTAAVLPETVGQYIGRHDSEETEVCEHDLLVIDTANCDEEDGLFEVEYDDGAYVARGNGLCYDISELRDEDIRVVGIAFEKEI